MEQLYNGGRSFFSIFRKGDFFKRDIGGRWHPVEQTSDLEVGDIVRVDGYHENNIFEVLSATPSAVEIRPTGLNHG